MIVIVASRYDASARRLKDRWVDEGGVLFTPEDLSVSGWRYQVSDPQNSTAIVGRRQVRQSEIQGVFTRLQWIWEGELVDIVSDDRAYVAAEMSAFLLCWLSGLKCPLLNRPSANCLAGPGWSREQWNLAASKAGMLVPPINRRASLASFSSRSVTADEAPPVSVTVVGDRCLGDVDKTLSVQASRLADIAKMDFLTVQFSSSEADASFADVSTIPDIDSDIIADAVLSYFARV